MPVTGLTVMYRALQVLKKQGFTVGSEIKFGNLREALNELGYLDQRTHQKYWDFLKSSRYVKVEPVFAERLILKKDLDLHSLNIDKRSWILNRGRREPNLSLFSKEQCETEKVKIGEKVILESFPKAPPGEIKV